MNIQQKIMTTEQPKEKQENMLVNLLFNIIIPIFFLSRMPNRILNWFFSNPEMLTPFWALVIALAFPVSYGLYDFITRRKANALSILGFVSVLATGVIGLLNFSSQWIAVKEAAVPLIIAIGVLVSTKTKYPLVKTFIYNDKLLDINRIETELEAHNKKNEFDRMLNLSSVYLAGSFLISSILNFVLAKIIVHSPTGTPEFNDELSLMYTLSYPVIALPCTIIMVVILLYVNRSVCKYTGLSDDDIYAPHLREKMSKMEKTK
jgi:intracellular septation protein A